MLKEEIKLYKDNQGYVNPYLVNTSQGRQSDNGTMFSSEYYIMLSKRQEDTERDADEWEVLIAKCMPIPGLTVRYPGDIAIDAPDNIYAILAASKVLNRPHVAKSMLDYGFKHRGYYNIETPTWNWAGLQWRQLQMIFAMLCASNTYKWWKFWYWPLELYSALAIAISCMNTPTYETDPRRLNWLFIQSVKEDSLLCRLATKVWFKRLKKDYDVTENAMRVVAKTYYQDDHPFAKFWMD